MRFLIDAQLPPGLARNLCLEGHDAIHVCDLLNADASDIEVLEKAHELNAVIITKDEDFGDLERRGLINTGVLWIRIGNTTNRALWAKIQPLLADIVQAFVSGAKLVEII